MSGNLQLPITLGGKMAFPRLQFLLTYPSSLSFYHYKQMKVPIIKSQSFDVIGIQCKAQTWKTRMSMNGNAFTVLCSHYPMKGEREKRASFIFTLSYHKI